jgi:acyl-CoA synthetase (AMP-forming)/AMP-acid ligase II
MDVIAIHAESKPDQPALVEGSRVWSWADLLDRRNRLAHALLDLGLRRGEQAVIYATNSLENLLAGAAVRAVGAVAVMMNHRLVAEEVAYILDDADAACVFVGQAFLQTAEAVRGEARTVRHWVTLDGEAPGWATSMGALLAAGRPDPLPADLATGLGASMIYTGGTTGRPKGALRTAIDPRISLGFMEALGMIHPDHVHLVAGPLYHSAPAGFALYAQLLGATVVVMPRFDPAEALALVGRHRVTSSFMAPTLIKRIVDLPEAERRRHDLSSLRTLVVAGAPCPMRVKEEALRLFGPVLYEFYGSTELGINTVLRPEEMLARPGSCGRAAPGVELAVLDDEGRPVPPGTPGELCVRRYAGAFDAYYKNPEATRETERGDWLTVGDVAWMDAAGFVHICDRKRDMIISGGVNIYPAEIEDALHRHPDVEDVAVFGVPDEEWGERVHAAVQPRPGAALTAEAVVRFARRHLADYKVPREVSFHAQLPRDQAGKLLKRVLREPHWAGRGSRI